MTIMRTDLESVTFKSEEGKSACIHREPGIGWF